VSREYTTLRFAAGHGLTTLEHATRRAIERYVETHAWERMKNAAMSQNFGWRRSGEGYVQAYGRALASRSARTRNSVEAP